MKMEFRGERLSYNPYTSQRFLLAVGLTEKYVCWRSGILLVVFV
jgi:hypothetical protein